MKHFLSLAFFIFANVTIAQNINNDYRLLDKIIPLLNQGKEPYVHTQRAPFVNQEVFFSKTFLKSYTYPTIGADSRKIKKLIHSLDFVYLSQCKRKELDWDFSKITNTLAVYKESDSKVGPVSSCKISSPVYTKNGKTAFIYYELICWLPDCGSASVFVFRKHGKIWKLYTTVPIWIS